MIVYSPTITNRLRYVSNFIGTQLTGKPFVLTNNKDEFDSSTAFRINYSTGKSDETSFWIKPHPLLNEAGINNHAIECFEINNQKAFFRSDGDIGFDVFSTIFYLLSRYEEYLPHTKDKYGRYAHENSIAYRENFLHIPLVNLWLQSLKEKLLEKFRSSDSDKELIETLSTSRTSFEFIPTYDIDEAYSFRNKQGWRSLGGITKDALTGRFKRVATRIRVLNKKYLDPFDSYEWMDNLHKQYSLKPIYFFLVAEKTGRYDKNILPARRELQELIQRHAEKYPIGVHPSWQSGDKPTLVKEEIHRLQQLSGKTINSSRQHFIRFNLPETYQQLINAGIRNDYSMGYGSINGFRASVCSSFYWYDLQEEETTQLLIRPFCFMEANSFFEQKSTAEHALKEMRNYYDVVRSVNGTLITIWHNTFLGTDPLFAGWRNVYNDFVKEIKERGTKRVANNIEA